MQPLNSYRYKNKHSWFSIPKFSVPTINLDQAKTFFMICSGLVCIGIFVFSAFVAYKIVRYEEIKMKKLTEYIDYKIYPIEAKVGLIKEEVDFLSSNAQIIEHRLKVRKYSIKKINGKDKLVYE